MTKTELLDAFLHRVWIAGDFAAAQDLFSPTATARGVVPAMAVGPEDFGIAAEALRGLVAAPAYRIERTVEQGDWLSALVSVRASGAANGHPVALTGQVMLRFDGDRVAEAHNHFDYLGFFEQLGLLPEEALGAFLSGRPVG
ncbi:MAG: ester cyclase [Paracoccaceae bacterium]